MSIDAGPLGKLTAEVMEEIEARELDGYHVRTIAIIVELDSEQRGELVIRCSDDRPWVSEAFLYEAFSTMQAAREAAGPHNA